MTEERRKPFFYKRLFRDGVLQILPEDRLIANSLEKEKMLSIRAGFAYLSDYCDDPIYSKQKSINERRYKTIISMSMMKEDGSKIILQKLYLPFHQTCSHAKKKFANLYPHLKEDLTHLLTIQYTDSVQRKVETVYETSSY